MPDTQGYGFGWKPDYPDIRDFKYELPEKPIEMPDIVDWTSICPPVYDQGQTSSCTGNAVAARCHTHELLMKKKLVPSRLFIYYNARLAIGEQDVDNGAMIRDAIKSLNKYGYCDEAKWPFEYARVTSQPTANCYKAAKQEIVRRYSRVPQDATSIQSVLARKLFVVFGFSVYESFMSQQVAATGYVNMPGPGERLLGGHAVSIVGYNRLNQRFLIRNSWGTSWGSRGYFTMPYQYVLHPYLSDDFWVVEY